MLSAVNAVNHVNHVNHVKKPYPHHRRALARVLQRRLPASDFWTWLTSLTRLTLLTADVVDIIDGVRVPGDCPRVFGQSRQKTIPPPPAGARSRFATPPTGVGFLDMVDVIDAVDVIDSGRC